VGFLALPIDWRVAGLVLAASIFAGLVFGGAPVFLGSSRSSLGLAVQRLGNRHGRRLRNALTVTQLAISLSLLVGALLLLGTIRNLLQVDLGFDPARIASASLSPFNNGYDDARSLAFYRDLLERAAAKPAVRAVSVSGGGPIVGTSFYERVHLPGRDREEAIAVATNNVSPDYFRVLGLAFQRGRGFSPDEVFMPPDGTCGPVIVSESLAIRLFGTRDVLDRVLVLPRARVPMECRVVGVVADVRNAPGGDWQPTLYRPLGRAGLFRVNVLARSDGPLPVAAAALREAAASIDPAIALYGRTSLAEGLEFRMAGQRIMSTVLAVLAVLGLLMAAVGLYGLVAETAVDRTREFAVRMAIGAEPRSILVTVLRHATILSGFGIMVGIVLSTGLARAIRSQLFGVREMEPWVHLSAAGLLAAVVVLASLAPALRASRTNPAGVLRTE
jgi:predicted permease